MKTKILAAGGRIVFWATWPYLYLHLIRSQRVRVLIMTSSEVLLIRAWHGSGTWTLPGGGIKPTEDAFSTAQREVMEEVSILLGREQFSPLTKATYKDRGLRFSCQYFVVKLSKALPIVAKPPEIVEVRWIPVNHLERFRLGPDVRQALMAHNALLQ